MCLVLHILNWKRDTICRQLDDTIFLGNKDDTVTWYTTYKEVCQELKVHVAPEVAAKAFGVTQKGSVLGLIFDLESFTWSMDWEKALKLIRLLHLIATDRKLLQRDLAKITGKINFYMDISHGR